MKLKKKLETTISRTDALSAAKRILDAIHLHHHTDADEKAADHALAFLKNPAKRITALADLIQGEKNASG